GDTIGGRRPIRLRVKQRVLQSDRIDRAMRECGRIGTQQIVLRQRRHLAGDGVLSLDQTKTFVVGEEKGLVADNRTANRSAKLILAQFWLGIVRAKLEGGGVQDVIAKKLIRRTMK